MTALDAEKELCYEITTGWSEGIDRKTWDKLNEYYYGAISPSTGEENLFVKNYDVILEPTAVGNLMMRLMFSLSARSADEGRSFFSKSGGGNRIGEQLFDERITLSSNPAEANAEMAPFTDAGLPITREVWIENGVLQGLQYSRFWADRNDVAPRTNAGNCIMSGGDATLDDMVRETRRGVLITRLWYIRALNPRTISYTGLTRDGTFLIEDGRITRPVTNFRFNQSITEMLANIEMIGIPRRVASGEGAYGPPIVVPALKVRDFNLASVSDAI